jgi:hypothetical protein
MGYKSLMRDWIGTGVSLLGLALVVIAFIRIVRARAYRRSQLTRPDPDRRPAVPSRLRDRLGSRETDFAEAPQTPRDMTARHLLLHLCGGLVIVEAGQLIRAQGWLWAVMPMIVIGLIGAGSLLLYRDLRNARHR